VDVDVGLGRVDNTGVHCIDYDFGILRTEVLVQPFGMQEHCELRPAVLCVWIVVLVDLLQRSELCVGGGALVDARRQIHNTDCVSGFGSLLQRGEQVRRQNNMTEAVSGQRADLTSWTCSLTGWLTCGCQLLACQAVWS